MKMTRRFRPGCMLYYIAFAAYITLAALKNSMLGQNQQIVGMMKYVQILCLALIMMKKLLEKKHTLGRLGLWLIETVCALAVVTSMGETFPFFVMILLLGAEGCSARVITGIHFICVGGGSRSVHFAVFVRNN